MSFGKGIKKRSFAVLVVLAVALFSIPEFGAAPGGIGTGGDEGCLCHNNAIPSSDTVVTLTGLPGTFNASTEYPLVLTVENQNIIGSQDTDGRNGGFRILFSSGDLSGDAALTKIKDGGLTHTEAGNDFRTWNLTWTSPSNDAQTVDFIVHGNAVSGDADGVANGGEQWNTASYSVSGAGLAGGIIPVEQSDPFAVLMAAIILAVLLIFAGLVFAFYRNNPENFGLEPFWIWLKEWLTTTDHKGVGTLYFVYSFFFFLVGGLLALLFRIQLALPNNDFIPADQYNSFFTLHGTTMIFLAAMPMIAAFANWIIPLQIGAKDLAFPRVNAMGFWMIFFASFLIYAGVANGEGADISWVMYPPYSSDGGAVGPASKGTTLFLTGIFMLAISSTLSGVNFIATIFTMRAPGVTWMKMPLFTWSILVANFMLYISLPALAVGTLFLLLDRTIGTTFFDVTLGGDPILFQHLFWFFGHPEVYVVILPAFGVISEVLATSARRSIFGYKSMVYAMAGIGIVGFIVWGHHMLTSGMDPALRFIMMLTTMLVAIPTGVKIFNWLATLWGGSLVFKTHTLWALGFIVTFTMGGLSGMFFPVVGMDTHFHDTYFVVAHFHYVLVGGTMFGMFSAIYYWYPKATGKKLSERLGLLHFLVGFISYNATFWPMHTLGIMGMPRRYHTYAAESGFGDLNMMISVWAFVFGLSQLILLWNMIYSYKKGIPAGNDPWGGWSLEWATSSPPPTPSFHEIPTQGNDPANEGHEDGFLVRWSAKLWFAGVKEKEVTK